MAAASARRWCRSSHLPLLRRPAVASALLAAAGVLLLVVTLLRPDCNGGGSGSHLSSSSPSTGDLFLFVAAADDDDDDAPTAKGDEKKEESSPGGGGGKAEDESALRQVSGDEMYSTIRQNDSVLVEFFAPWCGHCQSLFPELLKAAEMVKKAGMKTKMLQVDATKELVAAQEYKVQGYPTFKYFRGKSFDNPTSPEVGRTANSIFDWVVTQEKGPMSELAAEELSGFIHNHRAKERTVSVIAYAVRKTKRVKLYEDFARENKRDRLNFHIVFVDDKNAVKVEFYRWSQAYKTKGEEEVLTYKGKANGGWTKTDLLHFLKKAQDRLLMENIGFSPFQNPTEPLTLLWVMTRKKNDDLQEYVDALLPIAEKKKDLIQFCILQFPPTDDIPSLLDAGIDPTKFQEELLLVEMENAETKKMTMKYHRPDITSADDVRLFIKEYSQKVLTPFRKSQNPAPPQEGDVVPIVAHSFERIALDPKKHVFVMYMAPWCGHCKMLKPIWAELAGEVAKSKQYKKKVVIASMDATANDLHDLGVVSGYPTLVIYPAGTKRLTDHVVYSGQRTKEELWSFLEDVADVSDDDDDDEL